nr:extensin-like [Aegilops tauschii subsp. strangulata]
MPASTRSPPTAPSSTPSRLCPSVHYPVPEAPRRRPPRAASTPRVSSAHGWTPRARRSRPGRLRLRPRLCLPASTRPPHTGSGSPRRPGHPTPGPAPAPPLAASGSVPRRPRLQPGPPPPLPRRVLAAGCCRDPAAGRCGIPASCDGRLRPMTRPAGFPGDPACRLPRNPDADFWRDPAVGFRRVPLLSARQAEHKKNREKKRRGRLECV